MDEEDVEPGSSEAENGPEKIAQSHGESGKVASNSTRLVIIGIVAFLLGLGIAAVMPLSFAKSEANAEFSVETVVVGAQEEVVFEISTREGRYDWQITSDSAFDGYLVLNEHFPAYRAGEDFPRVAVEENIRYWTPFLQTGGNSNHGIAVVNPGDEDMSVRVQTMFRTNPAYWFFCLVPVGLLIALGGIVMSIIGIVRKIRTRSHTTA